MEFWSYHFRAICEWNHIHGENRNKSASGAIFFTQKGYMTNVYRKIFDENVPSPNSQIALEVDVDILQTIRWYVSSNPLGPT